MTTFASPAVLPPSMPDSGAWTEAESSAIHELALDLAGAVDGFGSGDAVALDLLASKYPTGALAVLDVRDPWERLGPGSATLERFVTPRMLDPADGP